VAKRGVRNTVGFDFDPRTKELWFTDNQRDRLSKDEPLDEFARGDRRRRLTLRSPRTCLFFSRAFARARSRSPSPPVHDEAFLAVQSPRAALTSFRPSWCWL
jgi:hypothetical protein